MSAADSAYSAFISEILHRGEIREDRTGVGTRGVFGRTMRFRMSDGFPLLTTKRLHWPSILHELLWILKGDTNVRYLQENGVRIWNEWADENGDLGPVYGAQLRYWPNGQKCPTCRGIGTLDDAHCGDISFNTWTCPTCLGTGKESIDQLKQLVEGLRRHPFSRRHVVTLWNPAQLDEMALPPCHGIAIQFNVRASGELDLQMYQRSADAFLGVPFNVASYALLLHMVAASIGRTPGDFIWVGGDCHIYSNHEELVCMQLDRAGFKAPSIKVTPGKEVWDMTAADIELIGYQSHPAIKAEVAV